MGSWWTGISTGSSFITTLWAVWNPNATWVDVKVGDFNGDGKADITGRYLQGGSWWTGLSTGSSFTTSLWAEWNPSATWVDVQVGDFNGDGKADITGRYLQGSSWWTGISTWFLLHHKPLGRLERQRHLGGRTLGRLRLMQAMGRSSFAVRIVSTTRQKPCRTRVRRPASSAESRSRAKRGQHFCNSSFSLSTKKLASNP